MNAPNPTTIDSPRTVADAIADTRLDQLLDDAIAPKCEAVDDNDRPDCDAAAVSICILSCGHSAFFCEEHTEELRNSIELHKTTPGNRDLTCEYPLAQSPRHPRPMFVTVRFERIAS